MKLKLKLLKKRNILGKSSGGCTVVYCSLSAKESLRAVKNARNNGQKNIYVETCTQYLTLTDEMFVKGGPEKGILYMLAPPLRKQEDIETLVRNWKWRYTGNSYRSLPILKPEQKRNSGIKDDFRFAPGGISGVEES